MHRQGTFLSPHTPHLAPLSYLMTCTRVYIFVFDNAFSVNLMEVVIALVNDSCINILQCHPLPLDFISYIRFTQKKTHFIFPAIKFHKKEKENKMILFG